MPLMEELLSNPVMKEFFSDPVVLAILLISPLFVHFFRSTFFPKLNLPPSPPRLPLIGNLHQLGALPHRGLAALAEKYGPLMIIHMASARTLIVTSPDVAREVLKTHDVVFSDRPVMKAARLLFYDCAGVGFSPVGDYWRTVKKLCSLHLLSPKLVRTYHIMREDEVSRMLDRIDEASKAGFVDVTEELNIFSIDSVCRVVAGKQLREDGRTEKVRKLLKDSAIVFGTLFFEDLVPSLAWLDSLLGLDKRAKKNFKDWDVLLDRVITEHEGEEVQEGEEKDFIHVFLEHVATPGTDVSLTRDQIKAIVLDMLAAGTDTSNATLEWAMAELALYPRVLKKLQSEVRGVARGQAIVHEVQLDKMDYLKATIKEVLRLHPPAPLLLPHFSTDDCQIDGYHIPKQTRVMINAWAIGRDPNYWESPEEFRPERFLDEPFDYKGTKFQYIPFGAGRRTCPGMPFAVAVMELALANLVHRFDWELPAGATKENFQMLEISGLTGRRVPPLLLVAKPFKA